MKKIFSIMLIFFILLSLVGCNPERNEYYNRQISNKEILVEKHSSGLYFSFIVRPQIDANNLMITIGFYDKNENPIGARTKNLGAVLKGQEYHLEFTTSDFTTKEYLAISKYKFLEASTLIRIDQETHGICFEHAYDNGYISKQATCGYVGEKIFTCKTCNYKKTEKIKRTSHNWIDNIYSDMKYICINCCAQCDWKD